MGGGALDCVSMALREVLCLVYLTVFTDQTTKMSRVRVSVPGPVIDC